MTTQKEKIEYLAKAVMTLSELGDGKTACALNEIRLEMKSQLELPEGLEEAAEEYIKKGKYLPEAFVVRPAFKAGAEYQRKQDQQLIELAEDHAMLAGMNKMKEQMMEKAVEGEVIGYDDGTGKFITVLEDLPDDSPYKVHDKVKLIVIPEEK